MVKIVVILLMLMLPTLYAAYDEKVKLPNITFHMQADENFKAMQRNCQWCHSYGYILNQGKQSRRYWHNMVVRMREVYKAPISKHDEKLVTEYLYKYYGK